MRFLAGLLAALAWALAPAGTPPPGTPARGPGPVADEELEQAADLLRRAIQAGNARERALALEDLLAFRHADVSAVLVSEYAIASEALREVRDRIVASELLLAQNQEGLAVLLARGESTPGFERTKEQKEREIEDLERGLERSRDKERHYTAVTSELAIATRALFNDLGSGNRRKAEKAIWNDAREHASFAARLGSIEILGQIGDARFVKEILELAGDLEKRRFDLRKEVQRHEGEIHAFERRLQKELDEGRANRASSQQYRMLKQGAAQRRRELTLLAFLIDASVEAAGSCLARGEPKAVEKTLGYLVRAQKRKDHGANLRVIDVLRHAEGEVVGAALHRVLDQVRDPLELAQVLDAFAAREDRSIEAAVLGEYLAHENWLVRSRAIALLERLRSAAAVPALIERLDVEIGRTRSEAVRALESLTGQRFGSRVELWRRWWNDHRADFRVPERRAETEGSRDVQELVGVTFFGITTESQRVLFILDVSGSMERPMTGRTGGGAARGQTTRLDVAKRELVKALGGIRDGGVFNILLFATDVWTWADEMVEMEEEVRSEVLGYVGDLTANGGTNIYGALKRGFDLAGVEEQSEWSEPLVDTIYFLSDGEASVGVTTETADILSFVRGLNRSAGITIHTIGLSDEQDAHLLKNLAEESGGEYVAR